MFDEQYGDIHPKDRVKWVVPASRNRHLIRAAIRKRQSRWTDAGGFYKGVWFLGRNRQLVLKRTELSAAWRELWPMFYAQVARRVIRPYRAWSVEVEDGAQWMFLLQHRLQDETLGLESREHQAETEYLYNYAMQGRDVNFRTPRNAGATRTGKLRVYDYGCGEWDCNMLAGVTIEEDYLVAYSGGLRPLADHVPAYQVSPP